MCSPEDAYRCFMRTEMDILVLENAILLKSDNLIGTTTDHGKKSSSWTDGERMTTESNTAMSGPELRQFGLLFGAILVLLFGLLLPFLIGYSFPLWPWVVALLFTALALLAPPH